MTIGLDYRHMARIVELVSSLSDSGVAEEQVALFWTVRNCLDRSKARAAPEAVAQACEMLRTYCKRGKTVCDGHIDGCFSDPHYCRAFGTFCGVLASDVPDPSDGACCFHRHDDVPAWSIGHVPSALIGRYFFYRRAPLRPPAPR
jgi:hypothetical protein